MSVDWESDVDVPELRGGEEAVGPLREGGARPIPLAT